MKKMSISALLLVLAMILGILAGCGNSTGAPAAGSETASAPAEAESAADDLFVPDVPVAAAEASAEEDAEPAGPSYTIPISEEPLTYSIWMTYAPFAADLVNVETMEGMLVLDKMQEITNIHFDVTAANGAAEQDNFNLMIASGDYADIMFAMG
jgi:ABC-type glycerol-3-phosphate transport system substrate-binding protein